MALPIPRIRVTRSPAVKSPKGKYSSCSVMVPATGSKLMTWPLTAWACKQAGLQSEHRCPGICEVSGSFESHSPAIMVQLQCLHKDPSSHQEDKAAS